MLVNILQSVKEWARDWSESTFLKLSGGTLTGALGGTTAAFSGKVEAGTYLQAKDNIVVGPSTTSASTAFDSTNPKIEFQNGDATQNGQLLFTDYDAVHPGATLAWTTDQPQSWFHTQYVKAKSNVDVDGTVVKRWPAMKYDTAPSATIYTQPTTTYDNAGNIIGHDEYSQQTNKTIGHNFAAVRQYNGSAWAWYQCAMYVSSAGAVTYSIHTPANFRSAIGVHSRYTQLYNNTSGSNAAITLSETAANYTWLRIYFYGKSNASGAVNRYGSVDVYSPNGKIVQLSVTGQGTSGAAQVLLHTKFVTISAKSVANTSYHSANIDAAGTGHGTNNEIYITRVEGWTN